MELYHAEKMVPPKTAVEEGVGPGVNQEREGRLYTLGCKGRVDNCNSGQIDDLTLY